MNHWSFVFFCCWKTQQVYSFNKMVTTVFFQRRKKITDSENAGAVSIFHDFILGKIVFSTVGEQTADNENPP